MAGIASAACQLAGVEPTFTTFNGDDPVAYILSAQHAPATYRPESARDGGRVKRRLFH